MDLKLKDKVVVITGGAKGIGAEATKLFYNEGAIPVIIDNDEIAGKKLSDELQGSTFVKTDLTKEVECEQAIKYTLTKYENIDILVNNAGINDGVGLGATAGDFKESLNKNLVHYYLMTKGFWESLKKTKGTIVNISSKVAIVGQGNTSGYAASKGAILGLTKEWALEGSKYEIRVNSVVPAEVYTRGYENWLQTLENPEKTKTTIEERIPLGKRMTRPREIAKTILYLASDMASHTTAETLFQDGGYSNIDNSVF